MWLSIKVRWCKQYFIHRELKKMNGNIAFFGTRWQSVSANQTGWTGSLTSWLTSPRRCPSSLSSFPHWRSQIISGQFSSVQLLSHVWLFSTRGLQHTRPPCPSPTPRVCSNSYPLSPWCHPTISSSPIPFSSHLQSFPASLCFPMSLFFASGGQSVGVSVSASVLPMNIQGWFPLRWTGWISLQSKGLSRIFSNTTVQKHLLFIEEGMILMVPRDLWLS